MRTPDLAPGFYWLTGYGDLGINGDTRRYIGGLVWYERVLKGGEILVRTFDGLQFKVLKGNLERH